MIPCVYPSSTYLTPIMQFFKRFPTLREKFYHVVIAFFKKALNPTNKLVTDLVRYVVRWHYSIRDLA